GNLVSGNKSNGVEIDDSNGSVVAGNLIGSDVTGTLALGNAGAGVSLARANTNQIGGTDPSTGNVLSGNSTGVLLQTGTGNHAQGSLIGTDVTGAAALPNAFGIYLGAGSNGNLLGGTNPGAGNTISGNLETGISFALQASGNLVQGNRIGTDAG